MDQRYLIDTSAAIKYLCGTFTEHGLVFLDGVVSKESIISFISEIELLAWNPPKESDLIVYQQFVQASRVLGIDKRVILKTIDIRKQFGLKLPDAVIASTALIHDLTLIADNDRDFLKVDGLKYINPNTV
jgi:tRNA(fMet)-specific endonuclease VapC